MKYKDLSEILDAINLEFEWDDCKRKGITLKEKASVRRFIEENTSPYLKLIQVPRPVRNRFYTPFIGSTSNIRSPNGGTFAKYERNGQIFNTMDACVFTHARSKSIRDIEAVITDFLEYEPTLFAECVFNSNIATPTKEKQLANFLSSLLFNNLSKNIDTVKQGVPHKNSPLLIIGKNDEHVNTQDNVDYLLGTPYLQAENISDGKNIVAFVNTVPKFQRVEFGYDEGYFTLLIESYYANVSQHRVYIGSNKR